MKVLLRAGLVIVATVSLCGVTPMLAHADATDPSDAVDIGAVVQLMRESTDVEQTFNQLTEAEREAFMKAGEVGEASISVTNVKAIPATDPDLLAAAKAPSLSADLDAALAEASAAARTVCSQGNIEQDYLGAIWPNFKLYSMGFTAKWCYKSGKTTSYTFIERHADTSYPGWSFEGFQPNVSNNHGTIYYGRIQGHFAFGISKVSQNSYPCLRIAGRASKNYDKANACNV